MVAMSVDRDSDPLLPFFGTVTDCSLRISSPPAASPGRHNVATTSTERQSMRNGDKFMDEAPSWLILARVNNTLGAKNDARPEIFHFP
jgi:hypothetical protein